MNLSEILFTWYLVVADYDCSPTLEGISIVSQKVRFTITIVSFYHKPYQWQSHQVWGFFTFLEDLAYCGPPSPPCHPASAIPDIYLIQLENFRSTFASKGFPSRMIQVLTILQSHNLHIFEMSAFMLKEIEKNVFNLSKKSYFAVVLYFIKSKTFIIDNFKG